MAKLKIDLRFVDILYELGAIGRYIASIESQMSSILQNEEQKAYDELRQKGYKPDDDEYDLARQMLHDLTERVIPRFYRNAILVNLWAIFETGITAVAKEIADKQKQALSLRDINGDFLERTKKYFQYILKFKLNLAGDEWVSIKRLKVLRNAIAHGNGNLDTITNPKEKRQITKWGNEGIGLSVEIDLLIFSRTFIEKTFNHMDTFLRELIARVKTIYPI